MLVIVTVIDLKSFIVGPLDRRFREMFQPERCRLIDSVFGKLMNIKCNGHLVWNMKEFQINLNATVIHNSNADLDSNSDSNPLCNNNSYSNILH